MENRLSLRPRSPKRSELINKLLMESVKSNYSTGVLLGNWVEDRAECPKQGTLYIPPVEKIDYDKMKPEFRRDMLSSNKLNNTQGNVFVVINHDSHSGRGNFSTTNDLVYNHLPKPLCGPPLRYYKRAQHTYFPQPDLLKPFGNLTEWGLNTYKKYEWACTDVSDYMSTLYEDTYVAPLPGQYLQRSERRAKNGAFTKTFRFKMTKPIAKPKQKK